MKTKELYVELEKYGWRCNYKNRDNHGVNLTLPKGDVSGYLEVSYRGSSISLDICLDYCPAWFAEICKYIDGDSSGRLVRVKRLVDIRLLDKSDVKFIDALTRAQFNSVDESVALETLCTVKQVTHGSQLAKIIALAYCRNIDALMAIKESFESGDRLGFFPVVTLEKVCRAILYAGRSEEIYNVTKSDNDLRASNDSGALPNSFNLCAQHCAYIIRQCTGRKVNWEVFDVFIVQSTLDRLHSRYDGLNSESIANDACSLACFAVSKAIIDLNDDFTWGRVENDRVGGEVIHKVTNTKYNLESMVMDILRAKERLSISEMYYRIVGHHR